jgi:hypothetical protein
MKKDYLLILLFFSAQLLFSQKYIKYYELVNSAEKQIVSGNYNESLKLYESAFSIVSTPIAKDLYNYIVCCCILKQFKKTFNSIVSLAIKGIKIDFYDGRIFEELKQSETWKTISLNYKKYEIQAKKSLNNYLINKVDSINYFDQLYRRKSEKYLKFNDSIRKYDSINLCSFKKIIIEFGVPDENILGLSSPRTMLSYYAFVRHITGDRNQNYGIELLDTLKNAVLNGKFNPQFYAWCSDTRSKSNFKESSFGTTAFVKIDSAVYPVKKDSVTIAKINSNRSKIGLDNFSDYCSKIIFSQTKTNFIFDNYFAVVQLNFSSEEQKNRYLNKISNNK